MNESEFLDLKVEKMPCCMSGRCNDLVIEEMMQLKMVRCSGGVAMGLLPRKVLT